MSLSDSVENEMIQDFVTRHPVLYVALSTADPGDDGSGIAEPTDPAYLRQLVGDVTITGNELTNDVGIQFPTSTEDQGTITYAALFSAESGGTYLGCGAITPTACPDNTIFLIAADTVILSMD